MTQLLEVAEKLKRLQAKRAAPRELIALLQKRAAAEAAAAVPPQLQLTGAGGGIAGAVADGAAGQEGDAAFGSAVQDMETAAQPMVRLAG